MGLLQDKATGTQHEELRGVGKSIKLSFHRMRHCACGLGYICLRIGVNTLPRQHDHACFQAKQYLLLAIWLYSLWLFYAPRLRSFPKFFVTEALTYIHIVALSLSRSFNMAACPAPMFYIYVLNIFYILYFSDLLLLYKTKHPDNRKP